MIWSLRTHSTRGGLVEILKRRCDRKAASGPYLRRSPGSTSRKISPCFLSSGAMTLALPIQPGRLRAEIIFLPLPIWRARIADCKGQPPEGAAALRRPIYRTLPDRSICHNNGMIATALSPI